MRSRSAAFCAFALTALTVAASARAEQPQARAPERAATHAPAPLASSLQGPAKAAYDAGKVLFDHKDFAGALAKFKQAHDQSGDARLLWNMAACETQQRHYAGAQGLLRRYLSEGGARLTADNRADADGSLKAIQAFVSDLRVTVSEPGAAITLDGEPLGASPLAQAVAVDLGHHVVRAQKEGFAPVERSFDAAGGEPVAVDIHLAHEAPVAKAPEAASRLLVTAGESDTVSIDGKVVGRGSFEGALPPGTHALRVTADGRKAYTAQIELPAGGVRTIEVTLEKDSPKMWPWIVGGAVLAGAAATTGFFLLRHPDHEAPTQGSAGTLTLK
jgi:hypothetical protein